MPISCLLSVLCVTAFSGGSPGDAKLAATIDDLMSRSAKFGFSGALLVAHDGKVILSKGYGFANVARRIPIGPHSVFSVASITKPFTATAILQLADAGKLKLTDRIG